MPDLRSLPCTAWCSGPAPYLIRGHPDAVPTKVGNLFKEWIPVFTGNPGFRLEFIPMKIGAGMTILPEGIIYKQTLMNYPLLPPSPPGERGKVMGSAFLLSYSGSLPVSRAGYETPAIFPSPPEQP